MKEAEEKLTRLEKLEKLKEQGEAVFSTSFVRNKLVGEVREKYSHLEPGEKVAEEFALAGRVMGIRDHGKIAFADFKDGSGKIQLYLSPQSLGEKYHHFIELVDFGDIIGVNGSVLKTKRGELSIEVKDFKVLAKSLLPWPEKWHGLRDVEARYRQRYLDLVVNPEVRQIFELRTKVIKLIREFLDERGFQEVETPILQPLPGGALAKPFSTYHNALGIELYLRIAPELYLKRLVIGGLEKVYELNRSFRNEGISIKHNPEFTMLEVYQAFADYRDMMELVKEMLKYVVEKAKGSLKINYQGQEIDFSAFSAISYLEALKKIAGLEVGFDREWSELKELARKEGIEVKNYWGKGKIIAELFEKLVEPKLIQPTFVLDYPREISPLARRHPKNPELTERFELIVAGRELANAFSELNDPLEQKERFEEQAKLKAEGEEETQLYDRDFLQALEYGMPPTGGLGVGIDRLVMLLSDVYSIREVLLFPQLRPEE